MELLGKGSFASVYIMLISRYIKLKIYKQNKYMQQKLIIEKHLINLNINLNLWYSLFPIKVELMIKNEIMVLRKVIHPGIIRLYEVI